MFEVEATDRPAAPAGVDDARCRLDDLPEWLCELPMWAPGPTDVPHPGADQWLPDRWLPDQRLPDSGPVDWPDAEQILAGLTAADAPADPLVSVVERDPSGWLALELDQATAGLSGLSDAELIDATVAWERIGSWAAARQARVLAEFARRRPGDDPQAVMCRNASAGSEWAPDEIGLALHLSRGAAMARLGRAASLIGPLAATLALLECGRLDVGKARAICDTVAFLPPGVATAVQDRVLPKAPEQTVAQLRAALARAIIALDPRGAAERHREARRQRHVRLTERDDGMASLWALLSAPDAMASYEWLSRLARSLGSDDPREMDARRADLLVDLLTGRLELQSDPGEADPAEAGPGEVDPGEGGFAEGDVAEADPAQAGFTETKPADGDPAGEGPTTDPADEGPTTDPADEDATTAPAGEDPTTDPARATDSTVEPGTDSIGTAVPRHPAPSEADRDPRPSRAGPRPAAAGKPLVHVTIPYTTLMGIDDDPAELAGYGPIPAELAREIAADGVWKRLVTDPLSGALLDHGRTTYRPPAALADYVRARDGRCRFPTCRRQADNCELDHVVPWAEGGVTADHNLSTGCTHHHHTKHRPGWTVRMLRDGRIEWITPTGHHYLGDPHDYRPADDPEPALLRRSTGRDPVPDELGAEPLQKPPRQLRPVGGLGAEAMFGRIHQPDLSRPPPDPDGPPF